MVAFIDILTSQLFALGFIGFIILYITLNSFWSYKQGKKDNLNIPSGFLPLATLGVYIFITGLFGQFTWPLPGNYNILFYDIYPLVGLLFISFAWSLKSGLNLQHVGFFAMMLGMMTIFYGYEGYALGLTTIPIALLGLYTLFGIAGILGYPITVMLDRAKAGVKNKSMLWIILVLAFSAFLILGSLTAIAIAAAAIPEHLAS